MKNRKRTKGLIIFVFLVVLGNLSLGMTSNPEEKVAIVCFLDGKAWISETNGNEHSEIDLFDWIKIGASIRTNHESSMILAFSNGDRYKLGEKTKATVGQNGFESYIGSVKQLTPVPIMPQIVSISQKTRPGRKLGGIRIRGLKKSISGLYPNNGATVLADEAVITFEPIEGVERYMVEIKDEWGHRIFSVETGSHRVAILPGTLRPGADFYLSVLTLEKGKSSVVSEAIFATVREEDAWARNAFKTQVSQSGDMANLLLLARVDMALGLRKEACETLKAVLSLFPSNLKIKNVISQTGCE